MGGRATQKGGQGWQTGTGAGKKGAQAGQREGWA